MTETIGTFFLVLTVIFCVTGPGSGPLVPLAAGGMLAAMMYAGGPVSGGHFNPAVSVAAFLRGSLPGRMLLPYWVGQSFGALLAAGAVYAIKGGVSSQPMVPAEMSALYAEFFFTFALCHVFLNTTTVRAAGGNACHGMATGLVYAAGIFAVGGISGGLFNPAIALGLCGLNLLSFESLWIYLAAGSAAAVMAAGIFRLVHGRDPRIPNQS
jgi:aquaporin Z